MARIRNRLTQKQVKALRDPGIYADGGGLYLRVFRSAAQRSWIAIFRHDGRRREMGLGSVDSVSLDFARDKAAEVRDQVARGIDPLAARKANRAIPTFGEMADAWIAEKLKGVRGDKTEARWKRAVGVGGVAEPFRASRVDRVSTENVIGVLLPIWQEKAETARKTRSYIENVLDYAKAHKHRDGDNPARWTGHLEHLLADQLAKAESHAAVPWLEMPAFWADLCGRRQSVSNKALRAVILTVARTGEILGCRGRELDLDAGIWTIPAGRMKEEEEHQVALSPAAIALFRSIKCKPDQLVFAGPRGGKMSDNALLAYMHDELGRPETVHGFRSSFRDWAGDGSDHQRELAEMALAHKVGNSTELSYRRGRALEKRRVMMQDWADFLAAVK